MRTLYKVTMGILIVSLVGCASYVRTEMRSYSRLSDVQGKTFSFTSVVLNDIRKDAYVTQIVYQLEKNHMKRVGEGLKSDYMIDFQVSVNHHREVSYQNKVEVVPMRAMINDQSQGESSKKKYIYMDVPQNKVVENVSEYDINHLNLQMMQYDKDSQLKVVYDTEVVARTYGMRFDQVFPYLLESALKNFPNARMAQDEYKIQD